jgi:transposase
MLKYAVGLDVSSKNIHACLSYIDSQQKIKVVTSKVIYNTVDGYKKLIEWIDLNAKDKNIPLIIGMEATGIYHEECAYYLHDKKYSICVVLPNYAKKYLQASGIKSKNDKIDAKGLSKMFAERAFTLWQPMGRFYYELRAMTRHHQALNEMKTAAMNQHSSLKRGAFVIEQVLMMQKDNIKNLATLIKEIEKKIKNHIKENKEITSKVANVLSITGIGIITAAVLIAETNGFILFENNRQLVSYSGYDVIENQSGKHRGKTKISKRGNSHIRRAMFMPAFCAVREKCKPFLDLYSRTFENHKIKMKSYVAVQKKLLVIFYTIWKKDVPFTESYLIENTGELEQVSPSLDSLEQAEKVMPD